MKSPPSKGSSTESRRMKRKVPAVPISPGEPTAPDHDQTIAGVVTRATAKRFSIKLSSKLISSPKKPSNKSRVTVKSKLKPISSKDVNNEREKPNDSPTINANNEESVKISKAKKRNVSQKSPMSKDKDKANCIAASPKLDTGICTQEAKITKIKSPQVVQLSTKSPSKLKQEIIVPDIPQLVADTDICLNSDIKEETEKKDNGDEIGEESLSKNQCSVDVQSAPAADVCTFIDQLEATPNITNKAKPSSPAKKLVTPKKVVIEDKSDTDDDSDAESRKEIMRSAEKRIIRNLSTSESESRNAGLQQIKMSNIFQDSTGSDSDSAPEVVTFNDSRKSAFEVRKHADESIKRDKQRKKDKRKERLEMIRQRKEDNLIRLKERKANLEDASCSSSEESVHDLNGLSIDRFKIVGKKTYNFDDIEVKKPKSVSNTGVKRLPSELLENLPDQLPKKLKTSHSLSANKISPAKEKIDMLRLPSCKTKRDIDFIPVASSGSTQFGVVPLNKPQLKTVSQQAADFRNNMLYGSRVNRVPASTLITNRQKLSAQKVYK